MKFLTVLSLMACTAFAAPIDEVTTTPESLSFAVLSLFGSPSVGYESIDTAPVSQDTYNKLLKYSRLAGISYCVGFETTIDKPFRCGLQCKEFPNTEVLYVYQDIQFDPTLPSYIAVDHNSKEIYTVFRGTRSVGDAITDLEINQKSLTNFAWGKNITASQTCENCKVHEGFLRAYNLTYNRISKNLDDVILKYPDYSQTIVGHSLGGAVALLFGISMKVNGHDPLVVTYGQPLVGNKEFADWADQLFFGQTKPNVLSDFPSRKFYRVTHLGDIVPTVPFWSGYTHTSGEIFLDQKNGVLPSLKNVKFCQGQVNKKCAAGTPFNKKLILLEHLEYFILLGLCRI
uniref:triacylglycerol lipase n=1 Tax=[Candida] hispaniensis TaxID=312227 RepID=A0A078BML5_9ASCO|nr:Triacylglycerol lipase precursor [[Candida] hispaniensis]